MKNKNRGFTLIELLVVIAIIGLLSSVVLASLKAGRDKATETKMVESVKAFKNAIELFRADKGRYPGGPTSPSSFYVGKYNGVTYSGQTGDFAGSNFTKYMNLSSFFNPKNLPDNTSIDYVQNIPAPYEDQFGGENIIFVCEGDEQKPYASFTADRYVVNITYDYNSKIFSKFPNVMARSPSYYDFAAGLPAADSGIGYFGNSGTSKGACFTTK